MVQKTQHILIGIGVLMLLLLLSEFVHMRETFIDNQVTQNCMMCVKYFSGALSLRDPTAIPAYVDAHSSYLLGLLDQVLYFLDNKPTVCETLPTDIPQLLACWQKFVSTKMYDPCMINPETGSKDTANQPKCAVITSLMDDLIQKAMICSNVSCNDIKVYPRAEEQATCRATNTCKKLDDFERNIRSQQKVLRDAIIQCKVLLMDSNGSCVTYFSKVIQTKQDAQKASEMAAADKAQGPSLGSIVGQKDSEFDMATLVVANSS